MKVKPFVASVDDYFDNGMAEYPLSARLFYYLVLTVLLVFTKLAWPWKIECRELLGEGKPAEGETGKVIICNHTSMLEIIAIVVDGWTRHRRVRPLFKSEFAKNKIIDCDIKKKGKLPRFFLRVWMRVAEPVTEASVPAGYTRKQRVQWMEDESIARMIGTRDWLKREHCGRN